MKHKAVSNITPYNMTEFHGVYIKDIFLALTDNTLDHYTITTAIK